MIIRLINFKYTYCKHCQFNNRALINRNYMELERRVRWVRTPNSGIGMSCKEPVPFIISRKEPVLD